MNETFEAEAFGTDFLAIMLVVYLIAIILGLAQYILFSLGLYDTARKRGIANAWAAWIPLIGHWVLGAVVDHYAAQRGGKRRWGKVMLSICIVIVAAYLLFFGVMIVGGMTMALLLEYSDGQAIAVGAIICMVISYVALIVACIAYMPCYAVCLYKVYEEIVPDKAVKYLLLSYLVPLAVGICMMRCSRVPVEAFPVGIEAPGAGEFVPQDPFTQSNTEE